MIFNLEIILFYITIFTYLFKTSSYTFLYNIIIFNLKIHFGLIQNALKNIK